MTLTKKQIQWLAGAAGGVIAFIVVVQLLVVPMVRDTKANRAATRELRSQLDKARKVVGTGVEIQRKLQQTHAGIQALATNMPLPVLGNYLLAREQQLRAVCASLNIEVSAVQEFEVSKLPGWNDLFKVYCVRVVGFAGVNDLARCFYLLQKQNPLLAVTAFTIVPQEGTPDIQNFSFVATWLIWTDPDQRPLFLREMLPETP